MGRVGTYTLLTLRSPDELLDGMWEGRVEVDSAKELTRVFNAAYRFKARIELSRNVKKRGAGYHSHIYSFQGDSPCLSLWLCSNP